MKTNKFIIGLTGNIATGKSVIRRMLENHGALGIDADLIAHRTLYPEGAAYQPVLDAFGDEIRAPDGAISRGKLGSIVFNDPVRLRQLEAIIHPAVTSAIRTRIDRAQTPLIAIEAIKLLESDLAGVCNAVWVSDASESVQLERLLQFRNMHPQDARQRIAAQPPQAEKRAQADRVIRTEGSFAATWRQINEALNDTIKDESNLIPIPLQGQDSWRTAFAGWLHPNRLSALWQAQPDTPDLYETLAFNTLMPMLHPDHPALCLVWDSWNFTGTLKRTIGRLSNAAWLCHLPTMLNAFSAHFQWELMLIPNQTATPIRNSLQDHGFQQRTFDQLPYPAWRQALCRHTQGAQSSALTKITADPIETDHSVQPTK